MPSLTRQPSTDPIDPARGPLRHLRSASSESPAGFHRNGWPVSIGISGQFHWNAHLTELEEEIATFIRDNPARFEFLNISEKPAKSGDQVLLNIEVKFHIPSAPPSMGPIVGDIVHNLRSSLDMMACELARLNSKSDKSVY